MALPEVTVQPLDSHGAPAGQPITVRVGEYVLLRNAINTAMPHVGLVEKLWQTPSGGRVVTYSKFFRPEETFHVPSRSFFQNEVLRSSDLFSQPVESIMRHCCVLHHKDYMRLQPVDIAPEDTFVCESKYTVKGKSIKPIKLWCVWFREGNGSERSGGEREGRRNNHSLFLTSLLTPAGRRWTTSRRRWNASGRWRQFRAFDQCFLTRPSTAGRHCHPMSAT